MEVAQRTGVHAFHAGFPWLSPHHQVPNFQALPGNARLVKKSNRPSSRVGEGDEQLKEWKPCKQISKKKLNENNALCNKIRDNIIIGFPEEKEKREEFLKKKT